VSYDKDLANEEHVVLDAARRATWLRANLSAELQVEANASFAAGQAALEEAWAHG
jgi:hypothetical protein